MLMRRYLTSLNIPPENARRQQQYHIICQVRAPGLGASYSLPKNGTCVKDRTCSHWPNIVTGIILQASHLPASAYNARRKHSSALLLCA